VRPGLKLDIQHWPEKFLRAPFVAFPQYPAGLPNIFARCLASPFEGPYLTLSSIHSFASALALAVTLVPGSRALAQGAADVPSNSHALTARLTAWYEAASRRAPGQWGIAVADQTGRTLWSVHPDEPLVPASTVKLFTTGFARSVLGSGARRPTRVTGVGGLDPETGEWEGSWALELNGDPTLERAQGSGPSLYDLALQLASAGIRKLKGPLQVRSAEGPATAVYPAAWSNRHRGRLFAPPVGPLTVHENIVWITVRPGARVGRKARLWRPLPKALRRW
jgi:D-alanyl-D-alanine carboxypeptidase